MTSTTDLFETPPRRVDDSQFNATLTSTLGSHSSTTITLNNNINMNKFICLVFALLVSSAHGFSPIHNPSSVASRTTSTTSSGGISSGSTTTSLYSKNELDRRSAMTSAVSLLTGAVAAVSMAPQSALAQVSQTVVVAGATGQTGRRVVERLAAQAGWTVIGGVRNVDKATKSLSESSTVIRGAMVQQVNSIDTAQVQLKHLDVVQDSVDTLKETLRGADALVIAVGFVPGNPLKMNEEAHKVDNVGTIKLIDAAKAAGLKKVVMVSSILTDGRSWGQEQSPGFVITNAFGKVLDEKIVAENYLRASGLDYTIVRPGGLKAQPPTGALMVSGENTLNSGEISRDLVADVCIASLSDAKASNKVLEIIENDGTPPQVFNGLVM